MSRKVKTHTHMIAPFGVTEREKSEIEKAAKIRRIGLSELVRKSAVTSAKKTIRDEARKIRDSE